MEETFKSNFACDIGFNRSIIVECKTNKTYIDFASVCVTDGVPCKVRNKSLRLPIPAWKIFTQTLEQIEDFFTKLCLSENINFKLHLGSEIYLSMTGGVLCVDIRKYYTDSNGETQPGRPGIGLKLAEFQELLNITDDINDRLTEDKQAVSGRDTPDISHFTGTQPIPIPRGHVDRAEFHELLNKTDKRAVSGRDTHVDSLR
jgi:hypothetical protein